MSTATNEGQTRNQLFVNYDISKLFVWKNRYSTGSFTNGTGSELVLPAGTLMGRISATGKIAIMKSGSTDGSQIPIGVLAENITLANGVSSDLNFCKEGDVVESKLVFDGTDDLDTEITISAADNVTAIYRDLIAGLGINLVGGDELTGYDNV